MDKKNKLKENINKAITKIVNIQKIILKYDEESSNECINDILKYLQRLQTNINADIVPIRYYDSFDSDIINATNFLSIDENWIDDRYCEKNNINTDYIKRIISTNITTERISPSIAPLLFKLVFFEKLNFFNSNLVIVGANGSGKTSLSNELKQSIGIQQGIVISAQRVLIIPTFGGISNSKETKQILENNQQNTRNSKVTYTTKNDGDSWSLMREIGGEFKILLDNLLAERALTRNQHCDNLENGTATGIPPKTNLDKAINHWNFLIEHRKLVCDGVNFFLTGTDINKYEAYQMSDGEKVILYFVAQILQAPKNGFIIIDEPEMYLHKTILNKLWDLLEQERRDCLFVYLTHDLEFASSRIAKKIWIKSFKFPNQWEFEPLPENEIPEELLMRLLGSNKPILFCEGKRGSSLDVKIYNMLFPHLTVVPVDTCKDVINYTKAYNKIESKTKNAIGIVDSDFRTIDEINALKIHHIYALQFSEIENILLNELFLKSFAKQILTEEDKIEIVKDKIINKLEQDIELQVSNFLSAKINHFFTYSHIEKGNTLEDVNIKFSDFQSQIKTQEWYEKRKNEIQKIIDEKNYPRALQVYNNKGLSQIVGQILCIGDFKDRSIKFLSETEDIKKEIRSYFPIELSQS